MKTCSKCGEEKPLDEYWRSKTGKDGRRADCRACRKVAQGEYYAENRDALLARKVEYYTENRESKLEYRAAYYRENRDRILDETAEYSAANPHIKWESGVRWRAKQYGTNPAIERFTKEDVIAKYGDRCWHCKSAPFEELDHYPISISHGGDHVIENAKPACRACNRPGRASHRNLERMNTQLTRQEH